MCKSFYDTIRLVKVVWWIISNGGSKALVGALLRHQLVPSIVCRIASVEFTVAGRSIGGLTGSRVAGSCGRIPVESSVCKLYHSLAPLGFATGIASLTSATFVDNIYAFSSNAVDAVQQLVLIKEDLKSCWGLTVNQDSKEYMVCKGGVS